MIVPAGFVYCPTCGHLNLRDHLNPTGRCTPERDTAADTTPPLEGASS